MNPTLNRLKKDFERKHQPNNDGSNYVLVTCDDMADIVRYVESLEVENGKLCEQLQALMEHNAQLLANQGSVEIGDFMSRDSMSERAEP